MTAATPEPACCDRCVIRGTPAPPPRPALPPFRYAGWALWADVRLSACSLLQWPACDARMTAKADQRSMVATPL